MEAILEGRSHSATGRCDHFRLSSLGIAATICTAYAGCPGAFGIPTTANLQFTLNPGALDPGPFRVRLEPRFRAGRRLARTVELFYLQTSWRVRCKLELRGSGAPNSDEIICLGHWSHQLKAVILAGGFGTRISEETHLKPKPMVEIGAMPILWHIMKLYSAHGIDDFVICCGYKGYVIKEYFANYFLHMSDVTFDMQKNTMHVHHRKVEPWRVTLVDTGDDTLTGGRLKRVTEYVDQEGEFCFTYGDGLSNVDVSALVRFHRSHGRLATVTAVQPPGRYGALVTEGSKVRGFLEKPRGDGGWINGGFFVLSPRCLDHIAGDDTSWEAEPLDYLAQSGELVAYEHSGFWQPMDTLRDKVHLEQLWATGAAPWKVWA